MACFVKKNEALTFYQVVRVAAEELPPRRSVALVLKINVYYQERNALAKFCHCRTKRKRLGKRGIDWNEIYLCKWT
jgi:hypothetical protein